MATLATYYCDRVFRIYVCNYLYPPCEPNSSTVPIGVCTDECVKFVLRDNPCAMELELLANLRSDVPFLNQCNNTLELVQSRVAVNASAKCINISGMDYQC